MILLNLLVSIWACAVEAEADVKALAYADDTSVLGKRAAVALAGAISMVFCDLTGQELGLPKCVGFSTKQAASRHPKRNPLKMGGQPLKAVQAARVLGADMRFTPRRAPKAEVKHVQDRVEHASEEAQRIGRLPLQFARKVHMLKTQPAAVAFYGTECTQWTPVQASQVGRAVMEAIWGDGRKTHCREVVLTVLTPGHLLDPVQAIPFKRMMGLVTMLQKRPDLREAMLKVWKHNGRQRTLGGYEIGSRGPGAVGMGPNCSGLVCQESSVGCDHKPDHS